VGLFFFFWGGGFFVVVFLSFCWLFLFFDIFVLCACCLFYFCLVVVFCILVGCFVAFLFWRFLECFVAVGGGISLKYYENLYLGVNRGSSSVAEDRCSSTIVNL
jgi:hypothetical protein